MNYSDSIRRMNIGDILDYTVQVYKTHFRKLTFLSALLYVPFMLLYTLASSVLSSQLLGAVGGLAVTEQPTRLENFPFVFLAYYMSLLGLLLVYGAYSLTLKPVLDATIARYTFSTVVYGRQEDMKKLVKDNFGKFRSLLAGKLLYGLIIFAVSLVGYIVLILFTFVFTLAILFAFSGTGGIAAQIAVILLAVAVVLVLGLLVCYFLLKYSFGTYAIALENRTAVQSIARSGQLVKKNFWHVLGVNAFGYLLFYSLPGVLGGSAQFLIYFNKTLYIVLVTVFQVLGALLYPAMVIMGTLVYINLKICSEGFDLELQVDALLGKSEEMQAGVGEGEK